jgi:hypothetical protein
MMGFSDGFSFVVGIIIDIVVVILWHLPDELNRKKATKLANGQIAVSPATFKSLRKTKFSGKVKGVYLLLNKTKGIYYVGQSVDVFKRVNTHFTGRGNGDVYADYKYGDEFSIKMIPLDGSGFSDLNQLEKVMILTHDAYTRGYNRNRGNN